MQTCSRCMVANPDNAYVCQNCQASLSEFSTTAIAKHEFLLNPRVKRAYLITYHDCCPACKAAEGAYSKEDLPTLPTPGCSNPNGCRCFYQPFLEEIFP